MYLNKVVHKLRVYTQLYRVNWYKDVRHSETSTTAMRITAVPSPSRLKLELCPEGCQRCFIRASCYPLPQRAVIFCKLYMENRSVKVWNFTTQSGKCLGCAVCVTTPQ